MLKFFRDQKNSWLMKGILILTALSFVSLFGSGRFLERIPDEGKAIAKVHGEKITVAEFVNEVNHKARSLSNITQKPFTIQDIVQSGMLISLFNQMVSRSVMQATVDDLNLTVSDQAVRDEIKDMPVFTDYDGSFSMAAYKQYLSDMGISEKRFIDDAFLDMRAQQLTNAAKTVTIVPQKTAETLYSLQNEKRTADVFTITPADIRIKGNPNKEDQERDYNGDPACGSQRGVRSAERVCHCARQSEPIFQRVFKRIAECKRHKDGKNRTRELAYSFYKPAPRPDEQTQQENDKKDDVQNPCRRSRRCKNIQPFHLLIRVFCPSYHIYYTTSE